MGRKRTRPDILKPRLNRAFQTSDFGRRAKFRFWGAVRKLQTSRSRGSIADGNRYWTGVGHEGSE
jgi:hypothetical protein